MKIWSEIWESFREGSVITKLIYINVVIFVLFKVIEVVVFLAQGNNGWILQFELPAGINQVIRQPWSLITYMFMHSGFLHILFNLLVLYWFGQIFLDYYNESRMLGLYLLGGLSGGIVYIAAFNSFPAFAGAIAGSRLTGASAAIFAILTASAIRDPNRKIHLFLIGRVALKYLAVFLVIIYFIGIASANAGGNLAHLGGAILGWLFVVMEKKKRDITSFVPFFEKQISLLQWKRGKIKVIHKQVPRDDYEYNRQKAAMHEELNRILDKIGTEGYESLTRDEKETLFRHGK